MAVIGSSLAALAAMVLLARWEAWRRDQRARREEVVVVDDPSLASEDERVPDAEPWFDEEPDEADHNDPEPGEPTCRADVPEGRDHDPERGRRAYMTVDAIKARIRQEKAEAARQSATERTAPLRRVPAARRPSPYPRGGRRAAED